MQRRSVFEWIDALAGEPTADVSSSDSALLAEYARRAMATTFEVLLPYGISNVTEAAEDALDEIERVENLLTIYRQSSEVTDVNRQAADEPVRVSDELFRLLQFSAAITRQTAGAFDVATGALSRAWGFYRREGRVPSDAELREALAKCGMKRVLLRAPQKTVEFLRPGVELNFGSIGKGYALDRAAVILTERWNVRSALLHGGHSSIYALGSEPGRTDGWGVGIRHPSDPSRRIAEVRIKNQGLGTSAATFQHVVYNGRKLGHIIDPRTGRPAEKLASATVVAPTAAAADALATAFFILGIDGAVEYCRSRPSIGAVLLPCPPEIRPRILNPDVFAAISLPTHP